MDTDKITSALGYVGGVVAAAQPVLNGVQGSMHTGDWTQLIFAILFACLGHFTNKKA